MDLNTIGNIASIIGLIITFIGFYITISKIKQIHKRYQFKIKRTDLLSRLSHFYRQISICLNNPSLFKQSMDTNIAQCDNMLEYFENISPKIIKRKIINLRKVIKRYNKTKFNYANYVLNNINNVKVELGGFIEYLQHYK